MAVDGKISPQRLQEAKMEALSVSVSSVLEKAKKAAGSQLSPSVEHNLPAKRDQTGFPVLFDRECDLEIPSQLLSSWTPENGEREIIRELKPAERLNLNGRARALTEALQPYSEQETNRVEAELAAMFNGFRSMRQQGADVVGTIEITRRVLREFPVWAIAKGCMKIAQDRAELNARFAPNDAEIYRVVAEIVRHFRKTLAKVKSVLTAQIEKPEPKRPTLAEIEAMLGRKIIDDDHRERMRVAAMGDGRHAQRVMVDLAERKRAKEAATYPHQPPKPAENK